MEFVTLTPIIQPKYDTNLLGSILNFSAFNEKPKIITASYINNRIIINVKRGKNNVCFLLNKPFDYPNNFDYFQLSCNQKYSDMSSINEFMENVNNFIKKQIVNISFGYILEYISSKVNIISENLDLVTTIKTTEQITSSNQLAVITHSVKNDNDEYVDISNIQIENSNLTKKNVLFDNLLSFNNSMYTINPDEYELFKQKNLTQDILEIEYKSNFDKIFDSLLKTYRDLTKHLLPNNIISKNSLQVKIIYLNKLMHFRIIIPRLSFRTTYKFNIELIKLDNGNFNIDIVPYYPILDSNPFNYLKENDDIYSTLLHYINETIDTKKLHQKYIEEENFSKEYSLQLLKLLRLNRIDNNNQVEINKLNKYIKNFMNAVCSEKMSKQEKYDKVRNIFVQHGWTNGMNTNKYICDTISNLKIARYFENKEYYNILIRIIIFSFNDFYKVLNLDNLKNQYTNLLNLNRDRIDIIDSLFTIVENKT